jgi:hypothetical protein
LFHFLLDQGLGFSKGGTGCHEVYWLTANQSLRSRKESWLGDMSLLCTGIFTLLGLLVALRALEVRVVGAVEGLAVAAEDWLLTLIVLGLHDLSLACLNK